MIEILFRGKSIRGSEWEYGYVLISDDGKKATIYEPQDAEFNAWCVFPHGVLPDTVGQFTGLLDKSGNKIFDGDIVRTKYGRLCEVVWFTSPEFNGLDLRPVESEHRAPDKFDLWSNLTVVGNKWDNPELLNEDV